MYTGRLWLSYPSIFDFQKENNYTTYITGMSQYKNSYMYETYIK